MPGEPLLIDYSDYDRGEVVPFLLSGARRILDVGCASGGFGTHLGDQPNPRAAATARLVHPEVYEGVFPDAVPPEATCDCLVFTNGCRDRCSRRRRSPASDGVRRPGHLLRALLWSPRQTSSALVEAAFRA